MDNDKVMLWYGQKKKPVWKCELRLKSLCTAFDLTYPDCTPAPNNRASWYAGLRVILREFGEDGGVDFIHWSKPRTESSPHLTIVDAHSINYLFPKYKKFRRTNCPHCNQHYSMCSCEWGSQARSEKYGGDE